MDRIRSRRPVRECEVQIVAEGPKDRGHLGRLQIRDGRGIRWVWMFNCPWCRELIEIPAARVYVVAGAVSIRGGPVECHNCEQATAIRGGVGVYANGSG